MTKQTTVTNFTARVTVLHAMLARLQAGNPKGGKDVLNMLGKGKGGEAHKHAFTQTISDKIDEMGIDVSGIFNAARNPKVTMRFVQFIGAIIARKYAHIDRTSAKVLYSMKLAGEHALTTDALVYLVSGSMKKEGVSPESRGVSSRVVSRLFGSVGQTTAPTQVSRSVGDNGFMQLCGMTTAPTGKQNRAYVLNASHPLVKEFFAVVERATDGQLDEMTGDAAE